MILRLCHPSDFKGVSEYREDTGSFFGPFGEEERKIIEWYMSLINVTVLVQSNRGVGVYDEQSQTYDGCIGQLQSNESDVIMQIYEYPIEGDNITQGMIAYDTSLVMEGSYRKVEAGSSAQLLDSFASFSPGLWAACVLFCTTLALVLNISLRLYRYARRKKILPYSFYYTVVHCVRIGEIPVRDGTSMVCFICASIFSLVVLHYFCTLIKTQLVVIKDPDLFLSYQDIMDAKAVPYFVRGMSYSSYFSRKNALPFRKKLWNYAVNSVGDAEDLSIRIDPVSFLLIAFKVLEREAVMIMDTVVIPIVSGTGCPLANYAREKIEGTITLLSDVDKLPPLLSTLGMSEEEKDYIVQFLRKNPVHFDKVPEIHLHVARDPNEMFFSQGILQSAFTNEKIKRSLNVIIRRGIESGFNLKLMANLQRFNLLQDDPLIPALYGKKDKSRNHMVEECFSENFVSPRVESNALTRGNLKSLAALMLFLFTSAFIVLVIERKSLEKSKTRKNRAQ